MSFGLLKMQFQPMVIAKIFLGGGNPLPKPHPLDAFGVSFVPPLAAHFCPPNPKILATPLKLCIIYVVYYYHSIRNGDFPVNN